MAPKVAKRDKENLPLKSKAADLISDDFDDMDVDVDVVKKRSRAKDEDRPSTSSRSSKPESSLSDLQRQLAAKSADCERLQKRCDDFAKQFEELSRLRKTDVEALFEKYKEQVAIKMKAQQDLLTGQEALLKKEASKIQKLQKALSEARDESEREAKRAAQLEAPPVLEGKIDSFNPEALREEVHKLRKSIKSKDEQITTLQREYDEEVAHSRQMQRANEKRPSVPVASASAEAPSSEESEKDQQSLRFYEDATGFTILNVNLKETAAGKDITMSCLQSAEGRSFAFKLRRYAVLDRAARKWVKQLDFTPEKVENERDKVLVSRLGPFTQAFTVPLDELPSLWEDLRCRIGGSGKYAA